MDTENPYEAPATSYRVREDGISRRTFWILFVVIYAVGSFIPCVPLYKGTFFLGLAPLWVAYAFTTIGSVILLEPLHLLATLLLTFAAAYAYRVVFASKRQDPHEC